MGDRAVARVCNYRAWADRQLVSLGADTLVGVPSRLETGEPRRKVFHSHKERGGDKRPQDLAGSFLWARLGNRGEAPTLSRKSQTFYLFR